MSNWHSPYDDSDILRIVDHVDDGRAIPYELYNPDSEIYNNLTLTQYGWVTAAMHRRKLREFEGGCELRRRWEATPGAPMPDVPVFMFTPPVPDDASELIDPM